MTLPAHARLLTALLLVLLARAGVAEPIDLAGIDPADHAFDQWYLDTIDGKPCGYWHTWMKVKDGLITSGYEETRVEVHGGEKLTTRKRVVWTETTDFQPKQIVLKTASGSEAVTQTYRFTEQGIELTSEQDGRSIKRLLPAIQDAYLTAAQQSITTQLAFAKGVTGFELQTLDVTVGMKPFTTTYRRADWKPKRFKLADGSAIATTPWTVTYSILPGFEMHAWSSDAHHVIGVAYSFGGVSLTSRLADETVKDRAFDPPELAHLSVVVPDRPIEKPHLQRKIVYELRYSDGASDILPVETGHQSVERLANGAVRVSVNLAQRVDSEDARNDPPTAANFAASIRVDHEDANVRKLARQAVNRLDDDASPMDIAEACKRTVSRHLADATLSVGDATASEAARTGRGDCTESAVLLAALLRAHGIPSRCVLGLAYSEEPFAGQKNAFVYHMWTQAWIDNDQHQARWVDLDAALWRYSAGHIALGVSDMADDDQADEVKLIPMMRGLEIKIKETSR